MDYNTIQDTKNVLESYSQVTAELEALYKKAKENNNSSYELTKKELNNQYASDKNAVVTKSKLDEKELYQFLAARGLSSSGESVQAKINSNILMNNSLSDLAKANTSSLSSLSQEKLKKENELDTEHAEKKLSLDQWKTELATQIAAEKSSKTSTENTNHSDSADDKTETEKSYIPETSAKELVKNILTTYSTDGKITTSLQKSYVKQYLNTLSQNENVDADYLKELIINLKAAGYTDITDISSEANIAVQNGETYYDDAYEQLYSIFIKGNRSTATADKLAKEQAQILMLDYIYKRCSTIETFESACKKIGISNSALEEYYKRLKNIIEKDKSALQLGSEVN